MCGEHAPGIASAIWFQGSSPHVRGAQCSVQIRPDQVGIIPACAGSTKNFTISGSYNGDHPRMCGEHAKVPRVSRLQ